MSVSLTPYLISVMVYTIPDSDQGDPTIPRSAKVLIKEAWIEQIRGFLDTRIQPPDISDADFTSLVNSTTQIFLLNGALYRHEPHRQHQLGVPVEHRYGLIKEAHDSLGHKGVFSVRTCLLLHFWWPMLVDNIKWYNRTYHKCQI
jgi:hypothetical protein